MRAPPGVQDSFEGRELLFRRVEDDSQQDIAKGALVGVERLRRYPDTGIAVLGGVGVRVAEAAGQDDVGSSATGAVISRDGHSLVVIAVHPSPRARRPSGGAYQRSPPNRPY